MAARASSMERASASRSPTGGVSRFTETSLSASSADGRQSDGSRDATEPEEQSESLRDERYTTIKAQQKALIRESWNQFWRHKLHKGQSGFIRKLFIFDAVLGLVFIGGFIASGIYYHIYNRDVTGFEAGSGEEPSIVHPVTSAVMSMVVWWLYLPFIVAMWLLWLTSFALGAAICDAELIDVTKLVCTITPFEPEWENKVVIKLQKIRWRFFELLNNGWGSALGAQVLIFAAVNLLTLMHALNVMDALDNDDQAKARERERLPFFFAFSIFSALLLAFLAWVPAYLTSRCRSCARSSKPAACRFSPTLQSWTPASAATACEDDPG